MMTRKAPGARGRGRITVLTMAFAMVLMLVLCLAPAVFAVPKTGASAPGASGSAPGHTGELPATANAPKTTPGAPAILPDPPAYEPAGTATDNEPDTRAPAPKGSTADDGTSTKQTKVWVPNQPVTDKYDGPCTRHEDTYRKGAGHDWHRGEGVGHSGAKPSDDATESVPASDTPPPSDPETDTPSSEDTPTVPGDDPGDEPFLPFTPTQDQSGTLVPMLAVTKQTAREDEAFLPFTGGSAEYLLLLAAACALGGGVLRSRDRNVTRVARRIAR